MKNQQTHCPQCFHRLNLHMVEDLCICVPKQIERINEVKTFLNETMMLAQCRMSKTVENIIARGVGHLAGTYYVLNEQLQSMHLATVPAALVQKRNRK
jgi:hypothetical protein